MAKFVACEQPASSGTEPTEPTLAAHDCHEVVPLVVACVGRLPQPSARVLQTRAALTDSGGSEKRAILLWHAHHEGNTLTRRGGTRHSGVCG